MREFNTLRTCLTLGASLLLGLTMTSAASAQSILDGMSAEAIYADALWGLGGNTVDSLTGDPDTWIVDADPPVGDETDLKWDHLTSAWNGGIDQFGTPGGSCIFSNDDPAGATPAPMITTTALGLNSGLTYNVYMAYYNAGLGVNAALSGDSLNNYAGNYSIDTGVVGSNLDDGNVKLALLGEVSGVTEVAIDVGSNGFSYYEGLLVDIVMAPPSILDGFAAGSIYADASFGAAGNTVDSITGDPSSWVQDPPSGAVDDLRWDHNTADWNGGLTADGETGGTSFYSSDDPAGLTPAPMITTTATGLDPGETYNVYLTYYDIPTGVQAALSGETLETYLDNWDIDSGIPNEDAHTAKLALLGTVTGVSEVGIDVASTGSSYYDGLFLERLLTLIWDTTNSNWADAPGGDSHWEGGDLRQIPTLVDTVEIHAGTATVAAPGAAAKTLTATGGGVIIGNDQTLTIAESLDMQSGSTMTLRDGATLDVAGGSIAQMEIGGAAPADVTVRTQGTLDIDGFDNQGIGGTFTKSGSGTLSMINEPDGAVSAAGTTLKVAQGTLSLAGTDPLGGSTSIEMAGGTLSIGLSESILDLFESGAIYADAMFGVGGNTVNKATGSPDDWIADPPVDAEDGLWDHNDAAHGWNGGLDANGVPGGTSLFSSDDPLGGTPAPVITTTASGLNPAETYDVYLTYYNIPLGVQAALSGDPLQTYLDNFDVDTGIEAWPFSGTVKLALLGEVSGASEVAIDVGSTGSSYYEGLLVGTLGAGPDLTTTEVAVTADSTITTVLTRLDLGPLSLQGGVLTTGGAADRITFTDTTIPGGAVDVGFDTATNTEPGAITANGATIIKRGEADLIVDTPGDLTGATFDVQAGRLVAQHGSNPIDGATVQLTGGRLLLAAKPAAGSPVTYDNAVIVDAPGTIIAGAGDTGTSGVEVILGGINGLTVNDSVWLATTEDYTLNIAGPIDAAAGDLHVEQGTVEISGADNQIQQLTVDAGTLNLTGTGNQIQALSVRGGEANLPSGGIISELSVTAGALSTAGADLAVDRLTIPNGVTAGTGTSNHIAVGEKFQYGAFNITVSPAAPIQVSGESLSDAIDIGLAGGTVRIDGTGSGVVVPMDGLVAQWRFEDAEDLGHDSVLPARAYDVYGSPAQDAGGKFGAALRIDKDGSDSRLELDSTNLTGIYTISGWLNLDDPVQAWASALWGQWGTTYWAGYGTDHGDSTNPNFADWSGYATGGMNWYTTSEQPLDGPIEAGRWYHVVSVRDGNTAQLWIDGQKVGTAIAATAAAEPAGRVVIGNSNVLGNDYDGLIDELHVYNRALNDGEIAMLNNPDVLPGDIQLPQASIVVSADTTLELNAATDAELGNLTVADGVTLVTDHFGGGAVSVQDLSLGNGAQLGQGPDLVDPLLTGIACNLYVNGQANVGNSPGTAVIFGSLELDGGATLNIDIAGEANDRIQTDGSVTFQADIYLGGSLSVAGIEPITAGGSPVWGDQRLTILEIVDDEYEGTGIAAGGAFDGTIPSSYGVAGTLPSEGDYLGAGIWFGNASDDPAGENGIYYGFDKAEIGVFQAAPGDTDGNRKVEGQDILNILQAGLFGDGVTPEANWGNGDFNSDSKISGEDILALLGTGLFGDGTYPDSAAAAAAGADVKLVVTGDGLVIDTDGATVTGFVLSSGSGILTGDDAESLGLFQEDTDATISGAFAMSLGGEHALGNVIGQTDVDLGDDLTLAYTIAGVPGVFTASVVVPEPGTIVLLLGGLIGLLIWRRRVV